MAAIDFDIDEVEPRSGFDAIPAGKYKVIIIESEEKPTKKGDGSYIQFTLEIVEGEYKGRRLWDRLNLNNPNQTAVNIAKSTLSALYRASGLKQLRDTSELHDIEVMAKVSAKLDSYSGEVRNEVKGYESVNGQAATASGTSGGSGTREPAAKPATAPWKRNK